MVRGRLQQEYTREGFLLDGYPRTAGPGDELDGLLGGDERELAVVLLLTADHEDLVRRLMARAQGSGRSDNERVIRHRLDLCRGQTEAIAPSVN